MVRIPSLRRSETAPAQDENRDGRIDERDNPVSEDTKRTTEPVADSRRGVSRQDGDRSEVVPDRVDETRTYRSRAAAEGTAGSDGGTRGRTTTMDRTRPATDRPATDRPATDGAARDRSTEETTMHRPVPDRPATATGTARPATAPTTTRDVDAEREPEIAVVPGPKPRASLLATLGLIVGVTAALFVLTGTLAGYGIALGVLALLLSVGGLSATGRRHIAGKSDALIGLALGLGAIVVGILALTGQFAWPSGDADTVQRFREWLDSQFVDRF